ncbi:hypothetical protein J3459_007545 [Metarhizium acridum]|nr:hypothetical protein J3459_007545 [Metarhizium acridum]
MGQIMLKILFPGVQITDDEFTKSHAAGTLQYWHTSDNQYTLKCVDTSTGEIIGMGLGDVYLRERSPGERKNHGVPWLEGEHQERAKKVLNPLWEMRERLFGGRPYIYCHVIAVDPQLQGRKAGQLLLHWGMQMGELAGLPPSTVNLYKKMGFGLLPEKIVHRAEVLGTEKGFEVPLMVKMQCVAGGVTFEEWRQKLYPEFSKDALPVPVAAV